MYGLEDTLDNVAMVEKISCVVRFPIGPMDKLGIPNVNGPTLLYENELNEPYPPIGFYVNRGVIMIV